MNAWLVFAAFAVVAGIWTVAWIWIVTHARSPVPTKAGEEFDLAGARRILLPLLCTVAFVLFVTSLPRLPYVHARVRRLGAPVAHVAVTGLQWTWQLAPRHAPRRRSRRVRRDVARCEPRLRDLRLRGAAAHPGAGDAQLHQPTRLHVSRAGELCDPLSRVLRDRAPRDADDARGHGRRGSPSMSAAPVPEGVRDGGVLRAALAYLVTGFATFLLMGLLGLHMRLDQGGLMTVSPTWFYRIMTLHGSGMVAGTMLATMGGLAAAVERTVRLSARALWAAFLVYMLGMGFIVFATTLGGFAAGGAALCPPPPPGRLWAVWAAGAAFVGYLFVTLGFTFYCFHIAWQIAVERHGLGNALGWSLWRKTEPSDPRRPRSAVEIIATVVTLQGVFTGLVGAAYVVPVLLKDAGLVAALDPLLEKNLAYLFGHH